MLAVKIQIINKSRHALPAYETMLSAGMDLRANIEEPIVLPSLARQLVPTGLYIALPAGTEAQIRPRSGMAYKQGIIDADYRGEIKVLLVNLSSDEVTIQDGDRIAQMVIARHETIEWEHVEVLDETTRGAGGFGSTGSK
jgi:dUTP pyrophosphatase